MNKNSNSEKKSGGALARSLNRITPEKHQKTVKLMKLAAKIDDALKARGISKKAFAEKLGKSPSEISKWLGGTHNFTTSTLIDIEAALNIQLLDLREVHFGFEVFTIGKMSGSLNFYRFDSSSPVGQKENDADSLKIGLYNRWAHKAEVQAKAKDQDSILVDLGEPAKGYPA